MTQKISRVLVAVLVATLALATLTLFALQAEARDHGGNHDNGDGTEISIENKARITSNVTVSAVSGDAEAEGDDGGDGGDASQGTAGNGGRGGNGGRAVSGNAAAFGTLYGDVNSTELDVEMCDCEEEMQIMGIRSPFFNFENDSESLRISIRNRAHVDDTLDVSAETGEAEASGDDGGDGGDVMSRHSWWNWFMMKEGGDGGNGNAGGNGGTALSGNTRAEGLTDRLVNLSIVRVHRADTEEPDILPI